MKQKNNKIKINKRFFVFIGIVLVIIFIVIKGCNSKNIQNENIETVDTTIDQTKLNEDALSAIITNEFILKYVVTKLESSGMSLITDISMDLGRVNTYVILDDKNNLFYITLSDGGSITLYDSNNNIIG